MPRNGSTAGSAQTGVGGALSRFSRRSYAVDYIAMGCLVAGWVLVRDYLNDGSSLANELFKCIDPAFRPPLPSHVYTRQQVHSISLRSGGTSVCWSVCLSINKSPVYSFQPSMVDCLRRIMPTPDLRPLGRHVPPWLA